MKLFSNATENSGCTRAVSSGAGRTSAALIMILCMFSVASAQTSHSSASVTDNNNGNNSCNNFTGFGGSTSTASCTHIPVTPIVVTGGTGSAFSTSTNSTLTSTSTTTLAQTGSAHSMSAFTQALSNQSSFISVTGSLAPTDNIVFHFLTPNTQATGAHGTNASFAFWQLILDAGSFSGSESQYVYGDGTGGSTVYDPGATAAAGGVDFTVPLSTFTNPGFLNYVFEPFVQATLNSDQPPNTVLTASLTAILQGVDAKTEQGQYIASVMFNADGTGTLNATTPTTAPEPPTMVLLGSGLIGLIPIVRRRRSERGQ